MRPILRWFTATRRRKILSSLLAFLILLTSARFIFFKPKEVQAGWWNDDYHYRKRLVIDNAGGADSNKKVKFDIDTAATVDPETLNFHTQSTSFTEAMAKRDPSNVFAAAPIVQGKPDGEISDNLRSSRGSQIGGNFYTNLDPDQGSIVLWITPEWDADDGEAHYFFMDASGRVRLTKDSGVNLRLYVNGNVILHNVSSWVAGNTYLVVGRWDTKNTLDGINYLSLSVNDSHSFGHTSPISQSAPNASFYFGSNYSASSANAIIEGLTFYRRPLYDGNDDDGGGANCCGIDVGNGDEILKIYDSDESGDGSDPQDPTLVTGSWDVVFALPTDSSTGSLSTTGQAWTHPHSSNELYTDTDNTGGFMLDGVYGDDDWSDILTPTVAVLAPGEKIFAGGYKTTSSGADEGIEYDSFSVLTGEDFVIRAIAHGDVNSVPKISITGDDDAVISNALMTGVNETGTHTAGTHATIMTDSAATWTADEWIGYTIYNTTDGSSGTITDNDGTTATVSALTGGGDDQWESADEYRVGSNRTRPDIFLYTFEADDTEDIKVKLTNTAASGTCYWHQVEVLSNAYTNPSFETGSGTPWIPDGWTQVGGFEFVSGETAQEGSIVHSGSSSFKINTPGGSRFIRTDDINAYSAGKFFMQGFWAREDTATIKVWNESNAFRHHYLAPGSSTWEVNTGTSYAHYPSVIRADDIFARQRIYANASSLGYFDDIYLIPLTDVSLTVTAADEDDSTESTGLRVDGRDSATQSISNLTTTAGSIKFEYTPRHDAGDALDFLEDTDVYIAEFYGDADDYIKLYWGGNDSITMAYNMNAGGEVTGSAWTSTGITADTTYEFEITYTGGGDMILDVDGGADEITHSTIPAAFGTAPTTAHWGKRDSGSDDRQADATFDHWTQTTGTYMQPDCDDVRFTDINGRELKYYYDSANGICNTESSDLWVLVPTIHGSDDTIVYMYYGNPSASSGSQATQLSQDTFSPNSTTVGSQEKGPSPSGWWSFNEGYGTTTQDGTSNNNDGTISSASWVEESRCLAGKCLYFDSTDDVVTVTNASAIDMDEELVEGFTYQAWVRVNSDGEASQGEIFDKGANTYLRVTNDGTDGLADLEASVDLATDATLTITNGITLDQWQHVALTYTDDGDDEITIYIAGNDRGSSSDGVGSPATDANDLLIGGDSNNNFHGFIDEFKVYPFERTAAQMKTDYIKGNESLHGQSASFGDDDSWLSDGLVGYWKMDDADVESEGETSTDSSGNGNDGTLYGDDTNDDNGSGMDCTATGQFGTGCDFDGVDDYVDAGSGSSLDNPTNWTFTAWVNPDTLTPGYAPRLFEKSGGMYALMASNGGSITANSGCSGVDAYSVTSTGISAQTWTHVAIVYDDNTRYIKIFFNGVEQGYSTHTPGANSSTTHDDSSVNLIVANRAAFDRTFDGTIDETRIYNRALSPSEVSDLYNWAPGPVAHWKMDENTGTGSDAVKDTSGNANHGTMEASMTESDWMPGKYGSALEFDGSDDYVSVTDNDILDIAGSITMSAWVKPDSTSSYAGIIAKRDSSDFAYKLDLDFGGDNFRGYVSNNGVDSCTASDPTIFSTGVWYHLAYTYTESSGKFYRNGVEVGSCSTSPTISTSDIDLILGASTTTNQRFPGQIDDVRIYNYARTPGQIIEDMNAGHPAPGSPVGSPIGYWKFDEGYGDTANDSSLQGNDGDLAGSCPGDSTCPSWSNDGKFGKALDFDTSGATDDYVDCGTLTEAEGINTLSASAWVKFSSTNTDKGIVSKRDASNTGWVLRTAETGGKKAEIRLWASNTITSTGTTDLDDNAWHHVAFSYDGSTQKLYVDGVLEDSDSNSGNLNTGAQCNIGRYCWAESFCGYYDGLIDEVKIYNFALTQDQILADYNRGAAQVFGALSTDSSLDPSYSSLDSYCPPGQGSACTAPVAHWKMDENTGTSTVYDKSSSGTAYDLTMSNMAENDWGTGKIGQSLEFDGEQQCLIKTSPPYPHPDTISLSLWLYPTGVSSGGTTSTLIAHADNYWGAYNYRIGYNLTGVLVFSYGGVGTANTDQYTTGTGAITFDQWNHVALNFTYGTGSSMEIYVNGILISGSWTQYFGARAKYSHANADFAIGNLIGGSDHSQCYLYSGNSRSVKGKMDEIKIYDYARTQAQIAWDYNRGAPVGWWKFDECEGPTAYDASGNSNNGTITEPGSGSNTAIGTCSSGNGDEMWDNGTTGKRNASLDFDGTDDYVDAGDIETIDDSTKLSGCAWVDHDTLADDDYIISKYGTGGFLFLRDDVGSQTGRTDSYKIYVAGGSTAYVEGSTNSSPQDQWTHVCFTYKEGVANGLRLYVNGKEDPNSPADTTSITSIDAGSDPLYFGRSATGYYFNGQIDDVKIFNYALTDKQILNEYNEGAVHFGD